jgi:eukaryotic-like serine/threonine-protein kinase
MGPTGPKMGGGTFVGQTVDGRWELVSHLGSGRFGDVYAAEPRHLELAASAVKVAFPETEAARQAMLDEIRALAGLSHDGLVGYRDSGEIDEGVLAGSLYVVTELCDGALSDELSWGVPSGRLAGELGQVVIQLAAALSYLHGRGLIHRDVKPANILRSRDIWKLSDLGLLRAEQTGSSSVEGTAPYLAPEVSSPEGPGPASDIYALGVVIHEALTGEWPYEPRSGSWSGPPLDQGASLRISDDISPQWHRLIEMCLRTDPKRRPTADQLAPLVPMRRSALTMSRQSGRPAATKGTETLPPLLHSRRYTGRQLVLAAVVVAALSATATALVVGWRDGPGDAVVSSAVPTTASPVTTTPAVATTSAVTNVSAPRIPAGVSTASVLTEDVEGSVRIDDDNHLFDCDGHTINGAGESDREVGIIVQFRHNVVIANCVITGFETGIKVLSSTEVVVQRTEIRDSSGAGMTVEISSGVAVYDNSVHDNGGAGVLVRFGSRNSFEGNTITDNGTFGVRVLTSHENTFRANDVSGHLVYQFVLAERSRDNWLDLNAASGGFGGYMLETAFRSLLEDNTASGYWQVGFTVSAGSSGTVLRSNRADGEGAGRLGFSFSDSTLNTVVDNGSVGNRAGFDIDPSEVGNVVSNNVTLTASSS